MGSPRAGPLRERRQALRTSAQRENTAGATVAGLAPCRGARPLLTPTLTPPHPTPPHPTPQFYSMCSFTNPGVLGTPAEFRRHFEGAILAGGAAGGGGQGRRVEDGGDAEPLGGPSVLVRSSHD
jgi:hypothetical protein